MSRIALRSIIIAIVAASVFLVATILLVRWRSQLITQTVQVPIDTIALPLDANGHGLQIVANTELSVTLSSYPPRANTVSTLMLTADEWKTHAAREVTPTLEIAALNKVDAVTFMMMRITPGHYAASDIFFPARGPWRMRVRMTLDDGTPYTMLIVAEAK